MTVAEPAASSSAAIAAAEAAEHVTPIPGGYCVKILADGDACVDVLRMLFNWRIVVSPRIFSEVHTTHLAGFCYFGHGNYDDGTSRSMTSAYVAALGAAWLWDGQGEPLGYDKIAFDGRPQHDAFG